MFEHWKDHFHPHEGNDHKPTAYQTAGAVALGLVVLAILALSGLQTNYVTNSDRFLSAVLPSVLVDLTNEDRAEAGLATLEPNETLQEAAQLKANHMAEHSYFAHDAPDGTTPWEWFAQAGYEYETAGENLAVDFSDSKDVARAWMESPTHRENILEQGFSEIGIATAEGEYEGEETVFVVQMFARPTEAELAERAGESESLAVAEPTPTSSDPVDQDEANDSGEGAGATDEPEVAAGSEAEQQEEEPAPTTTADDTDETAEPAVQSATTSPTTTMTTTTTTTTPATSSVRSTVARSATTTSEQPATTTAQVEGESGIALLPFASSIERQASQLAHLVSQPKSIFKTLMFTLFALVALALLISVGLEAKRHHVDHALKTLGALVVLMIVFYIGMTFLFPQPEVAGEISDSYYNDSRLSADISVVGLTPAS